MKIKIGLQEFEAEVEVRLYSVDMRKLEGIVPTSLNPKFALYFSKWPEWGEPVTIERKEKTDDTKA